MFPITMIACGGANRTPQNPYGWQGFNSPGWFQARVEEAIAAGSDYILWHQPRTTWLEPAGDRKGQQGAHLVTRHNPVASFADLDEFQAANDYARFHGVVFIGAYVSGELLGDDGTSVTTPVCTNADHVRVFAKEARAYERLGVDHMIYDRGAVEANRPFMHQLDQLLGGIMSKAGALLVEAVPRDANGRPTWEFDCLMLDQFVAGDKWTKRNVEMWEVPTGITCHVIDRGKNLLTDEQWKTLADNGWIRGIALGKVDMTE